MPHESLYRRKEDEEWRERVDERLATLTASENVQNDKLDSLEEKLEDEDDLLRGDPVNKTDGLVKEIEDLERAVRLLTNVLKIDDTGNPGFDGTGKPGYLKKIDILWKGEDRAERRADRWWKGIGPIIVAVIGLTGGVLMSLDRITAAWRNLRLPTKTQTTAGKSPKGSKRNGIKSRRPPPAERSPDPEPDQ